MPKVQVLPLLGLHEMNCVLSKHFHQLQTKRICRHLLVEGVATFEPQVKTIQWLSPQVETITESNKETAELYRAELPRSVCKTCSILLLCFSFVFTENMSDRYFEIRKESFQGGNYIPSGRQLPRTPPLTDVKKHLDFSNDDSIKDCENTEVRADIVHHFTAPLYQTLLAWCII